MEDRLTEHSRSEPYNLLLRGHGGETGKRRMGGTQETSRGAWFGPCRQLGHTYQDYKWWWCVKLSIWFMAHSLGWRLLLPEWPGLWVSCR